jgi:uncharacterized protein (TIGR00661 family)
MKILYGIQTTGNGHITRSVRIIKKLESEGHQVDIITSGPKNNLLKNLKTRHYKGFTFKYNGDGTVNYLKTILTSNLLQFFKDVKSLNLEDYEMIITDYDPITSWAALLKEKCYISISNQSSFYSKKIPRPKSVDIFSEFGIKWLAPAQCPIGINYDNYDDFIFKPLLREDILNAKVSDKGYYLIYLPQIKLNKIIKECRENPLQNFIIFADVEKKFTQKNCEVHPINYGDFSFYLINCHGVVCSGGFQTTSEALYLQKKLMVVPVKGQWEQKCNSESLSRKGIWVSEFKELKSFIKSNKVVVPKWEDPIDSLMNKIRSLI